MTFLRHIERCNRHDPAGFRPFYIGGERVGWLRHATAELVASIEPAFLVGDDCVRLDPDITGFAERSAVFERCGPALLERGVIRQVRGEFFPVLSRWGAEPVARIDRGLVTAFGINAYGLHVNGFVRDGAGGISLWVAKRAADRAVEPGKRDNMVAGGQPFGLTIAENLIKEAHEEAGLAPALARRAVPVGVLTYTMESPVGLKPDTMFLYDLELARGHTPCNQDGEIECFELWPIDKVAASVRDTDDWKFNCTLVVIDFLVRHGWFRPDDPDYVALVTGLRR